MIHLIYTCIIIFHRKRGDYDKLGEGCNTAEKRPQHHSRQQPEPRTYPTQGQYRPSSLRSQTSDRPSSLNADAYKRDKAALDTKEEPREQPDAFGGGSMAYPQSYDTDNRQDKPNTQSNKSRFELCWSIVIVMLFSSLSLEYK